MDGVIQLSLGIKKQPVSGGCPPHQDPPPPSRVVIFPFTLVKNRVPELLLKVLATNGPSRVQSTVTLPSPGAVLSTSNDSVSPVPQNIPEFYRRLKLERAKRFHI